MNVHKSSVHNFQSWKQFKCPSLSFSSPSVDKWINSTMFYPYNGILLCNKKEQTIDIYNNLDILKRHLLSRRSQSLKVTYYIVPLYDSFEKIKLQAWGTNQWLLEELGLRREYDYKGIAPGIFGGDNGSFLYHILVMVT